MWLGGGILPAASPLPGRCECGAWTLFLHLQVALGLNRRTGVGPLPLHGSLGYGLGCPTTGSSWKAWPRLLSRVGGHASITGPPLRRSLEGTARPARAASCPQTGPALSRQPPPPQEAPAVRARSPTGLNCLRAPSGASRGHTSPEHLLIRGFSRSAMERERRTQAGRIPALALSEVLSGGPSGRAGVPTAGPIFPLPGGLQLMPGSRVMTAAGHPRAQARRGLCWPRELAAPGARFLAAEPGRHPGSGASRGLRDQRLSLPPGLPRGPAWT